METNRTAPTATSSQALRAISTAICAALFVVVLAFGAPSDNASRWDADVDAHSDVAHEVALDTTDTLDE